MRTGRSRTSSPWKCISPLQKDSRQVQGYWMVYVDSVCPEKQCLYVSIGFDKDVRPTKAKLYTHIRRHHAVPLTALWRFWRFSTVANARNTTCKKLETLVSDNGIAGKTRKNTRRTPVPRQSASREKTIGRPPRKRGMAQRTPKESMLPLQRTRKQRNTQ